MSQTPPPVLLPYQQAWVQDQAQVRVIEKSRRIGLSWAQASECALTSSLRRDAGGMNSWYIGYNREMALEFIQDVAFWARAYNLVADEMEEDVLEDEDRDIAAFRIKFASGWRVTALASTPKNLRGKQGLVVIDEAAFHDDLPGLLKAAMALLMWGGRVCVVSTHNGEAHAFNDLVLDCRAGRKPYSLHRVTLDDALADGLYQRICLRRGLEWSPEAEAQWRQELVDSYGEDAEEELFCIPRGGSGVWLSRSLLEQRMSEETPVLRLRLKDDFTHADEAEREAFVQAWLVDHVEPLLASADPGRPTYLGGDFGRTGDLTVFIPLQEDAHLRKRPLFYVELGNCPFAQQQQILFYLLERLPRFGAGALDARGIGQHLSELAAQRFGADRVIQVMLTVEWYRSHMPPLKAAIEDGDLEGIPKDLDVLGDLRLIKVVDGVPRVPGNARTRGQAGEQRHGDSAIALALGYFASKQDVAEIDFQSSGPRAMRSGLNDYLG